MTSVTRLEIGLAIFLVAVFLVPFGFLILAGMHVPYYPVSKEPVRDILDAKGIQAISVKDTRWDLPGATGGKTYMLIDKDNQQTMIATQSFEDAGARDAAIRSWHATTIGHGRPGGTLFVVGQYLVIVTPANRPVLEAIGPELTGNLKL